VNNVEIGFQSLAEHPDWIQHAVLSIDMIMLNNGMKECVLRRNAHLARIDFYVFDVLLIEFIAVLGQHHGSAVVEALKVRPTNGDINAPDHDVAFLLGIDHRFVHAFHCRFKINDLALAHAARWRLADAENFDGAIGPALADNDTDFGGSNLKTNHQIIARHCVNPFSVADWELPWGVVLNWCVPWTAVTRSPAFQTLDEGLFQKDAPGSPS